MTSQKNMSKISQIQIAVLGDNGVGKSTFINTYMNQNNTATTQQDGGISFTKDIHHSQIKIIMYEFSLIDKISISLIQECQAVFLMFDMASRDSFSNLFNNWFVWLRDKCRYDGLINVMGNYFSSNAYLFTNDEELTEAINISQINATFHEIGNKSLEEKISLVDDLIQDAELNELNRRTSALNNRAASGKDCLMF